MGWLIIGIISLIIVCIVLHKTDEPGGVMLLWIPGLILIVTLLSIFAAQVDKAESYQKMYHKYQVLSEYVDNAERADENYILYEEIQDYNKEIYAAKHEGFMTKWCHNPLYKELPYIEGTGNDLSEN